ncbi:hypothetical protein D3C76_986960 [compost metagenome]
MLIPDEINPGGGDIHILRHPHMHHLRPEILVRDHHPAGHNAVLHDLLPMVHIIHKPVQSRNPLQEALLQHIPFFLGNNPGNEIEGNGPLQGLDLRGGIEGEGDALLHHAPVEGRLLGPGLPRLQSRKPLIHLAVVGTDLKTVFRKHFIIETFQRIRRNRRPLHSSHSSKPLSM